MDRQPGKWRILTLVYTTVIYQSQYIVINYVSVNEYNLVKVKKPQFQTADEK